ncbi:MAG: preprotein translocase subunit YajC [Armatimonadetes bacterium]|nr:preprotein translocase subunit YajC [Armatimonadota bacterium]
MEQVSAFIPLIVLFAFMYFLVLRPQSVQARRRREMLSKLREGDRIVTVGGLYATILDVKEDTLTLELASNVRVKADRGAVQSVRGRQTKPAS